jgi:hypothetical protein
MSRYFAELNGNIVQRVVVCDDPAWLAATLGGTWVETYIETVDENGDVIDKAEQYAGIGFGWDDGSQYRFAEAWVQPVGAGSEYQPGSFVFHNNAIWQCRVINCVWEPGVFGWLDPISEVPKWIQPLGAGSEYALNDEVFHREKQWRSNVPANVWEPGGVGITQWDDITAADTPVEEFPAWVAWPGSGPTYQVGDKVSHNGLHWISNTPNNVWEPGVFGWDQVA